MGPHGFWGRCVRNGIRALFHSPTAALDWGTEMPARSSRRITWILECLWPISQGNQPGMELM